MLRIGDLRVGAILCVRDSISADRMATWRLDGRALTGGCMAGARFRVAALRPEVDRAPAGSAGPPFVMLQGEAQDPPVAYLVPERDLELFALDA